MNGYDVATTTPADGSAGTGGRLPAPGPLRLVQAFLNTNDIEAGVDRLATLDGFAAWASEVGIAGEPLAVGDLARLVRVREALRDTVDAATWSEAPGADVPSVLAEAARLSPITVTIAPDAGVRLEPAAGGDRVVGAILAAIAVASVNGTWQRLKTCRNDACRWVFYDASRNRSGHWCSMAICGNRMKGRAFRRRHRSAPSAPTGVTAAR